MVQLSGKNVVPLVLDIIHCFHLRKFTIQLDKPQGSIVNCFLEPVPFIK